MEIFMKTRLSAMAIAISSISMLSGCGGGGPSSFDGPVGSTGDVDVLPTVTVTAPATATSGAAFDVSWTSTDATSCTADFTDGVGTNGLSSEMETVGTKTFTVTCTGAGGSGIGSASVHVKPAGAEGAWDGATTTSNRAISGGVVTHEGEYWLPYAATNDATSAPAGFYAGSATNNTLAQQANVLRGFSFEGGGAKQGVLTGATYTGASTFAGSLEAVTVAPPNIWNIVVSGNNAFEALQGNLVMDFSGTWDDTANTGTMSGNTHSISDTIALSLNYTQTFTMDEATGAGKLNQLDALTCTDGPAFTAPGAFCGGFGPLLKGPYFNNTGNTTAAYQSKQAFVPAEGGVYQWTFQFNQVQPDENGNPVIVYTAVPMQVTMSQQLQSITADAFTSTYDAIYEETPSVETIAGSYTAGYTGIDTTMQTTASLTITSADGKITGTEPVSHCDYAATIAPHATGGNVYDVTALTFTDNGGSCVYTGQTFTGAATYDGTKLTLTATNVARNKGFMVVATK
jgi:hypothetical protein